ncbi:MAG: type IV pilus twitching motility protein PilT [Candidatus Vogelbacteria bacterium]|nr:type IV pilus twitching motility protein PilT [Candidatus Vogelbacteria bacterium]
MKLESIFRKAIEKKASDIYITTGSPPVFRISGDVVMSEEEQVLTDADARSYLLEAMNETQSAEFKQKMDVDFSVELPGVARVRANIFMQRRGIGGVFRLIPSKIPTMQELDLPEVFKRIPELPNGLVLVTGPTGSGKSTTLAALLNDINTNSDSHIITIEDPIEFVYENSKSVIDQREVHTHTESFASALRAALREDPDVILVGEMRDLETVSLAVTAAETGHLVFGTLHTNSAAKTIDRLINVFPGDRQNQARSELSEALKAVICQKLMKRADGKGRVAAYEIMFVNTAISNLIRDSKIHQIDSVIETSAQDGMQTMHRSIKGLLEKGIISPEEAEENSPTKSLKA